MHYIVLAFFVGEISRGGLLFFSLLHRDNLSLFEELYVSVVSWFGTATDTETSANFQLFSAWNVTEGTDVFQRAGQQESFSNN